MNEWSPKKLVLASMGVAIFSAALTGGVVAWLLNGQRPPQTEVFSPNGANPAMPMAHAPHGTPPADPVLAGNWYYDHQQWKEAIQAYEKALASGSDNPNVRTDLGNCFRFTGRPEAALEQYQIAQKQDPKHEHSLFNQVTLYAESLKNPAKAEEMARQFLTRFPTSGNIETVKKFVVNP
ncbi:MAG TPA: tetratricopeptide repeat protein [Chthoniobacterales bacterium]|jgi:tetratricopeptide (TPR) repeat protein